MGQSGSSEHRASGDKGKEIAGTYTQKGDIPSSADDNNASNKTSNNSNSSSPQKPPWAAMEGPVYICDYLGYKTLNKPATNIAGLQSIVKELYMQFQGSLQQGGPPKKSSFKITPGGLLVSRHESGGPLEIFFDINCINLIQAVRFAVLKGSEKKPKAVFVPLDDSRAQINVNKSAFSLEKAFHFLVKASHPSLLVCVLRRPRGVKALDCHVFGMDSPENALHVQSCVSQLMTSGGSAPGDNAFNRAGTRGDFVRTEFNDYNVYRGGPQGQQKFELKDEYFRGGVDSGGGFPPHLDPGLRGGGQPSPRETYPAESSERPRFGWSYDKPQSGEDFRRISGGPYGGGEGQPMSADMRLASNGGGNQYYPNTQQYSGERRLAELGSGGGGPVYSQSYRHMERTEVSHVRERSGDSGDNRFIMGGNHKVTSDQSAGGGGGMRVGDLPDSRYGPPLSPKSEAPPKVMQKPVSPVRGPSFRRTSPSPGGHAPLSPRQSTDTARTPTSPYSPTVGPSLIASGSFKEGPVCSLSNLESRGDDLSEQDTPSHSKPVAKVPPHLKGVKVLPSDFLAVKLKPKQQRADSEESDHGYDNHKNIMAQYKQLQLQEQDAQEGFKGFEELRSMDMPMSKSYSSNWNDSGRQPIEIAGSGYEYRRYGAGEMERRYIEQYSEQDTVQMRSHGRYEDSPVVGRNRHSSPGFGIGQGQGAYPMRGISAPSSAANDERQKDRKKDAEIANMFNSSYSGMPGRDEGFNADRNNFEQSLGYLP